MKLDKRIVLGTCMALCALPGTAWADFTVTFKNPLSEDVHIVQQGHQCIHHPEDFKTVIPAGKDISIKAEWSDLCDKGDNNAFIEVCVDNHGAVAGCVSIGFEDENKYVLVKKGEVGWPYLAFP